MVPPYERPYERRQQDSVALKKRSMGYTRVMIGPPGSKTRLHQTPLHMHAWAAQIRGRRQFVLFPPSDDHSIYAHEVP